jgi:hypothetical protein
MSILMDIVGYTIIVGAVVCPITWTVFEIKGIRRGRLVLGLISIVLCSTIAWGFNSVVTGLSRTKSINLSYLFSIRLLLDDSVAQLEAGNSEIVLKEFNRMHERFPIFWETAHTEFYDLFLESAGRIRRGLEEEGGTTLEPSQQIESGTPETVSPELK